MDGVLNFHIRYRCFLSERHLNGRMEDQAEKDLNGRVTRIVGVALANIDHQSHVAHHAGALAGPFLLLGPPRLPDPPWEPTLRLQPPLPSPVVSAHYCCDLTPL